MIKRGIQLRVVFHNLIFLILVAVITLAAALAPMLQDIAFSDNLEMQYHASQILLVFLARWAPFMVLVILFFILHQIVYTHRFLGPLINFTHTFRHISKGDLTRRCRLRKGDYLTDECKEINLMIDGLSELVIHAQQKCGELSDCLQKAIPSMSEEREEDFKETKEKVMKFKEAISRFKL